MDATISEGFDRTTFASIARIWGATCVGNPARGDTFESVEATLAYGGRIYTVIADEAVVAVCWITDDGRRLYLHHMAVAPEHQGKGFSKMLMAKALELARERRRQRQHHRPARRTVGPLPGEAQLRAGAI